MFGWSKLKTTAGFPVDDVVRASEPLITEPLIQFLARRFCRTVQILPQQDKAVVQCSADSRGCQCHPLIYAVQEAFSSHYPLTLSPDAIWLVIAQGFGHHIAENDEALRHRLVRHREKQTLLVTVEDLTLESFEGAIKGFSSQIREASDPVLHETLLCDFTTTTPGIRTASEVVLMDTYSAYFKYRMYCVCGIPRITVTGTVEDWERIRARVEVLETYDLGWWISRLRPILDEFVSTARGNPNREFWQAIYKPKRAYTMQSVTGWIADLFPYLGDAPGRRRNPILEHRRENWVIPVTSQKTLGRLYEPGSDKGIGTSAFPSGLSSVPVKLSFPDGSNYALDFVAGYFAVEQQSDDLSLSPAIGWCVTERTPEKPVLI